MTQDEIIAKLKQIMRRSTEAKVDWQSIRPEMTIASLGFDSLSILDLIYDLQQELGIDFDAEQLANVKTVGELAAFLAAQTGSAKP
jgi:acyl carrier protein